MKRTLLIASMLIATTILNCCDDLQEDKEGNNNSPDNEKIEENGDEPSAFLLFKDATNSFESQEATSYTGIIADMMYSTAFVLGSIHDDSHPFVEFSLDDNYSRLLFIAGTMNSFTQGKKSVLGVFCDGQKVMEKLFEEQSVPEQFDFDVSGVKVVRFERLTGTGDITIAEATLWTKDKQPHPTKPLYKAEAKPTQLVVELEPYFANSYHTLIGSKEGSEWKQEMIINGKEYTSGISMDANRRLIGDGQAATLFNLGGQYTQLQFVAGPISSAGGTTGRGWLTVVADGKILYEYECEENDLAQTLTIPINGCKRLSIESQNADGSLCIGAANIMVYPEGSEPIQGLTQPLVTSITTGAYRDLPDVCPLVRNIKPYALTGIVTFEDNVYDGRSDYRTFSMGGVKFNEGIILNSATSVLEDNTRSSAIFSLDGEFDYISFTTGWVSKCGVLKNDTLRVYADDEMVFNMPIVATRPNQHYTVPINKCHRLIFEKRGIMSLSHPVFGVADIVVYRGKPVENDLFEHPHPELPAEVDLIDLGAPYIHYVPSMKDYMDETFHDGTTQKEYFELNGNRIYKGFLLQTSVHFDLEAGVLGGEGGTAVAVGGMGASITVGTVGSATISAVCPFGALLMLAAGGSGYESSCAAFNAYEAYDELTFTVAPYQSRYQGISDTLLIGGNGEVIETFLLPDNMEPTTYTVQLQRCGQLMFWMPCGDGTSAQYLIYDAVLRRKGS